MSPIQIARRLSETSPRAKMLIMLGGDAVFLPLCMIAAVSLRLGSVEDALRTDADMQLMLALLIYAYATGVKSSRRIAAQIEDSLAFRVLARGLEPSHRTICRFREDHLDEFINLFAQVAQIAAEAGMVKLMLNSETVTEVRFWILNSRTTAVVTMIRAM